MILMPLGNRLIEALNELTAWWLGELLGLLPARWRAQMLRPDDRPVLTISPDVMMLRAGKGADDALILWEQPVAACGVVEAKQLGDAVAERSVHVRFDPAFGLRRTISMPTLARRDLGNAVAFQVEQYFPFRSDDVYVAFGFGTAADGRLSVPVSVIERSVLNSSVEALASAGVRVASYAVGGDDDILRFHIPPARPDRRRTLVRSGALGVSLATLVALGFAWYVHREAYIDFLEDGVHRQKVAALEARRLTDKVDAAQQARDWLAAQAARPDLAVLLDGLATHVPETAWAEQLELRGAQLRLQGYAADAVALPAQLAKAGLFRNVQFRAAMSGRADAGKERFDLTADVMEGNR